MIKTHVIKYCETVFVRNGKNLFWFVKNSGESLNKLKSKSYLISGVSTYNFSTLYTSLSHILIKEKQEKQMSPPFRNKKKITKLHLVMLQGNNLKNIYARLWFLCMTRRLKVLYKCMNFR